MPTPISSATTSPLATLNARQLIAAMREFRARTLALVADLDDRQMIGPRLAIVNPPLWEIGHLAWFQEKWCLRTDPPAGSLLENADRLYDSSAVPHDVRWDLPLPSVEQTKSYLRNVLERVTIADVVAGKLPRSVERLLEDPEAWKPH